MTGSWRWWKGRFWSFTIGPKLLGKSSRGQWRILFFSSFFLFFFELLVLKTCWENGNGFCEEYLLRSGLLFVQKESQW
jgi:hypothetical protein